MKSTRIIIFAKAPQPGVSKTRLIPALGEQGAADLAHRLLVETLHSALDAGLGPVELCMTPEHETPAWQSVALPDGLQFSDQGTGDLGARLARAARRAVDNLESVMLIGADCVEMSAALLRDAAAALQQTGTVINPATDGGYVLLGLTRFDELLFRDMPWSTAVVAAETLRRVGALGWPLHVGATLHDVDVPQDLKHLPAEWAPMPRSPSTTSFMPQAAAFLGVDLDA